MTSFSILVSLAYFCLCLETWETHPEQTLPTLVWIGLLAIASIFGLHWFFLVPAALLLVVYISLIGDKSLLLFFWTGFIVSIPILVYILTVVRG